MAKPSPSHWPIYKVGAIAVLPHTVQVAGGAFFETTPYRSVDLIEATLAQTLSAIFAVHNTRHVKRFSDSEVPMDRPTFLKLLGVKSEHAIQAQTQRWEVQCQDGRFTIEKLNPGTSRGFYERIVLGRELSINDTARDMALALTVYVRCRRKADDDRHTCVALIRRAPVNLIRPFGPPSPSPGEGTPLSAFEPDVRMGPSAVIKRLHNLISGASQPTSIPRDPCCFDAAGGAQFG